MTKKRTRRQKQQAREKRRERRRRERGSDRGASGRKWGLRRPRPGRAALDLARLQALVDSPVEVIEETLRQAGYSPDRPGELELGLMVFNVAAAMYLNTPKGRRALDGGSGNVVPEAAAIPNLADDGAMYRDVDHLMELMDRDPELKKIRFSRHRASEFLARAMDRAPRDKESLERYIDEVACRYVEEVEGKDRIREIGEGFEKAAARWGDDPEDLRGLVLGAFLAKAYFSGGHEFNPLVCVLFRKTVFEHVNLTKDIDGVLSQLGDKDELKNRLLSGDESLAEEMERLMGELDPDRLEAMRSAMDHQVEDVLGLIKAGRFPVPLPFGSVLPLIYRADRASRKGRPSKKKIENLLVQAVDELGPEDLRLYRIFLDEWYKQNARSHPDLAEAVTLVRTLATGNGLKPLDWPLLSMGTAEFAFSLMDGEAEAMPEIEDDAITPDSLRTYADFLEEQGYPAMALRTRNLADEEYG